jgi:hypothetical protein
VRLRENNRRLQMASPSILSCISDIIANDKHADSVYSNECIVTIICRCVTPFSRNLISRLAMNTRPIAINSTFVVCFFVIILYTYSLLQSEMNKATEELSRLRIATVEPSTSEMKLTTNFQSSLQRCILNGPSSTLKVY